MSNVHVCAGCCMARHSDGGGELAGHGASLTHPPHTRTDCYEVFGTYMKQLYRCATYM